MTAKFRTLPKTSGPKLDTWNKFQLLLTVLLVKLDTTQECPEEAQAPEDHVPNVAAEDKLAHQVTFDKNFSTFD